MIQNEPETLPHPVRQAIWKAFPDQAGEIISQLKWNRDHYYFIRWGMYVGVETDGYIHT